MYNFWYGYIKKRYGDTAELQMTDTDSLLFYCETADIYDDMSASMDMFDTSDFPNHHPLHSDRNKKVLGKMKDETNGKPISEFVGIRAKMYSFLCDNDNIKRAKGISKVVVKKDLKHDNYKTVVFSETQKVSSMTLIRSHKHELFCETIQKTGLSAFDDKRYLIDACRSYPYGHYKIKGEKSAMKNQSFEIKVKEDCKLKQDFVPIVNQTFTLGEAKITPCVKRS